MVCLATPTLSVEDFAFWLAAVPLPLQGFFFIIHLDNILVFICS